MATASEVVDAALASANEVLWTDVVSQLDPREAATLHDVMRDKKRKGQAWRRVSIDADGNTVLHIVKGRHPNLPETG